MHGHLNVKLFLLFFQIIIIAIVVDVVVDKTVLIFVGGFSFDTSKYGTNLMFIGPCIILIVE